MCVAEAGNDKATSAESDWAGLSKHPKKTKGRSEKCCGSRGRPDNHAKLEIIKLTNENFVTT